MTFESMLAGVRDRGRHVTIYRRRDEETDFDDWFINHAVSVDVRPLPPGGPDAFVAIESDGGFAGVLGEEQLSGLLEPPVVRPGERDDISAGYRVLFDVLDDTVFTSMERRQLLAVSREIEDRAYRVGAGTLRVGFQTLSAFEPQLDVYRHLATTTELDIHIYGSADWTPPEIAGVTYHTVDDSRARYWVLAFDGGPDDTQASGLVAKERSDGYDGFWTDDIGMVDEITAGLTTP